MIMKLQPVQVATGSSDRESRLVFEDGLLVAVLVQLSSEHDSEAGHWFLEAGFGRVDDPHAPIFADLDEAQAWIARQLSETRPVG
ncbi:hypothetical protein ASF49_10765 [Methylobacterium sp. Leaf104]|uniref:hypothetical protein n=1 Tax=Methylobacterium TaxID=407 RepID=UPI0006F422A5|nr:MULTISPECIES: hypothetical protein [Methylobacterium]KQP31058.1 hypothetical protein ASF49_10765 [Methylobacterium sp. Leaf104]MCI9881138.1 hypothetical protein [Methylobacterium goesingense]